MKAAKPPIELLNGQNFDKDEIFDSDEEGTFDKEFSRDSKMKADLNERQEKSKIKYIVNGYLKNFKNLRSNFVANDPKLIRELYNYSEENKMRLRELNMGDMKKLVFNEIQNQANSLDKFMKQWIILTNNIKEAFTELNNNCREKISLVKQIKVFEESIKKLEKRPQDRLALEMKRKFVSQKTQIDIEIAAPNLRRMNSEIIRGAGINSLEVLKVGLDNLKTREIPHINKRIGASKEKINSMKKSKKKMKTKIFFSLEYLLLQPEFVKKLGFRMIDCIRNVIVIGEEVTTDMIGGFFSIPEKEFMIEKGKLEAEYHGNFFLTLLKK